MPPWDPVEIVRQEGGLADGTKVELKIKLGPFKKTWISEHRNLITGFQFTDVQTKGPFSKWEHIHGFQEIDSKSSWLTDEIVYRLPLGFIGEYFGHHFVQRKLQRMFTYRHSQCKSELEFLSKYPSERKRFLISGSTGLLGTSLSAFLTAAGHEVVRLVRKQAKENEINWNPYEPVTDLERLENFDFFIHLSGANVAEKKWSTNFKSEIKKSRVDTTKALANAIFGLKNPPKAFLVASAVGIYGDRKDELLKEESIPGKGFLAEVAVEWERAAQTVAQSGIRCINLRFGTILSSLGGALPKLLKPAQFGILGPIGSGEQFMPWIDIDDAIGAIYHAAFTETLAGPINVVAPELVTNRQLTKNLNRILKRPTFFAIPESVIRGLFGEMGENTLLASQKVVPAWLHATGYRFRAPELEISLRRQLGKQ